MWRKVKRNAKDECKVYSMIKFSGPGCTETGRKVLKNTYDKPNIQELHISFLILSPNRTLFMCLA